MNLSLDSFEQQIDEMVLQRGYDYFQDGRVTEVNDLGDGVYEATVEGAEPYTVRLHLEGNRVTEYDCDCPYDRGPVCKHVAAVLFYLQKKLWDTVDMDGLKVRIPKRSRQQKQKAEAKSIETLLEELPVDELRSFLKERLAADENLKRLFICRYDMQQGCPSKDLCVRQVQALMEQWEDRNGYLGYHEASALGNGVFELLERNKLLKKRGKMREAVYMSEAVVEEMTRALEYADDSDGMIGSSIRAAIDWLAEFADMDLEEEVRTELFGWLLDSFGSKIRGIWEWRFDLMDIAIKMVKNEQEKQRVSACLDQIQPLGESWDWSYRQTQALWQKLIRQTEGETAAQCFIEQHLDNSDFREEVIGQALREKDYAKAERLAKEGIERDEQEYPGLADKWRDYLLTVYRETNQTEQTIRLARYFLLKGSGRFHQREYYYELLKSLVPQEQWQAFVEVLLADENQRGGYERYYHLADIYIWEAQWNKLYELLRQEPTFEHISIAEPYLAKDYATELAAMYRDLIVVYLENNVGRSHYQEVCRYIRRMKKLGVKDMAEDLVKQLRNVYARRRALLEELANV